MGGNGITRRLATATVVAITITTAGCGTGAVARSELESGVADQLEEQVGQRPEVECEDDLVAEVGETVRCELTADDGSTIGATVTADEVDGDVRYTIQVDDA